MTGITLGRLSLAWAGMALVLSACNQKPASAPPAQAASSAPPAAQAALPAVNPPFSVNEMMVMIVDQPGELLWDVEKGREPKSNEDWYQLEIHAVSLASAATVIQLGGTGPNDQAWAAEPAWRAAAQQLVKAALTARGAAKAKDKAALIMANGAIIDACDACHVKYKPNIPTGGLFIHKRPWDK
jgi:cytochrome c556